MAVAGAKKERGREKKSRIKSNAGVTTGTRKGKSAAYGPNVQLTFQVYIKEQEMCGQRLTKGKRK